MLTKIEKELNNLLKSREVDFDTRCGIMHTLKTEENYESLKNWITENPKAGQYEIMGRWDKMYQDMQNAAPRKTRKIAVF